MTTLHIAPSGSEELPYKVKGFTFIVVEDGFMYEIHHLYYNKQLPVGQRTKYNCLGEAQ